MFQKKSTADDLGPGRPRGALRTRTGLRPEPYERLLGDALHGVHTLFTRQDSIEETWRVVQPLFDHPGKVHPYEPGTWGPEAVLVWSRASPTGRIPGCRAAQASSPRAVRSRPEVGCGVVFGMQMSTWGTPTAVPVPRAGTVEVLVGLLAELGEATELGRLLRPRVCQAVVTLTSWALFCSTMRPAARVIPVGATGVAPELMKRIGGTLDETPIAQTALEEDRVVEVGVNGGDGDGGLAEHVPARYAELPESAYLTCTPISAARRWLGVIFADREGEDFPLDDGERETMMTLGRLAALTASVDALDRAARKRAPARRTGRADPRPARGRRPAPLRRRPRDRLRGGVLERRAAPLFQEELRSDVTDLRRALTRPLEAPLARGLPRRTARQPGRAPPRGGPSRRGRCPGRPREGRPSWSSTEGQAQRRPPRRPDRDQRPRRLRRRDLFSLQVENDGAGDDRTPAAVAGPFIAALEALRYEGLVEFGSPGDGPQHVRLVVPVECGSAPRAGPAGPGGQRPRRRLGGLPSAARAPELGRALPPRLDRFRAVQVCRKLQPEVALVDMLLGAQRWAPRSARRSTRSAPAPGCC